MASIAITEAITETVTGIDAWVAIGIEGVTTIDAGVGALVGTVVGCNDAGVELFPEM